MSNIVLVPRVKPGNPAYKDMSVVSMRTYKEYLAGEWTEEECPAPDWVQMWKKVFNVCYEHWKQGNNVFIAGADTIAVFPIDVFGKYHQMMLFWYTDPKIKTPYPNYLNAELVYLPKEMPERLWELARPKVEAMAGQYYDESQMIWNDMFWSQTPVPELDPTMHYSPCVETTIQPWQAKIWHFHSSRGPDDALKEMRRKAH